jgi:hypothetical protein
MRECQLAATATPPLEVEKFGSTSTTFIIPLYHHEISSDTDPTSWRSRAGFQDLAQTDTFFQIRCWPFFYPDNDITPSILYTPSSCSTTST